MPFTFFSRKPNDYQRLNQDLETGLSELPLMTKNEFYQCFLPNPSWKKPYRTPYEKIKAFSLKLDHCLLALENMPTKEIKTRITSNTPPQTQKKIKITTLLYIGSLLLTFGIGIPFLVKIERKISEFNKKTDQIEDEWNTQLIGNSTQTCRDATNGTLSQWTPSPWIYSFEDGDREALLVWNKICSLYLGSSTIDDALLLKLLPDACTLLFQQCCTALFERNPLIDQDTGAIISLIIISGISSIIYIGILLKSLSMPLFNYKRGLPALDDLSPELNADIISLYNQLEIRFNKTQTLSQTIKDLRKFKQMANSFLSNYERKMAFLMCPADDNGINEHSFFSLIRENIKGEKEKGNRTCKIDPTSGIATIVKHIFDFVDAPGNPPQVENTQTIKRP